MPPSHRSSSSHHSSSHSSHRSSHSSHSSGSSHYSGGSSSYTRTPILRQRFNQPTNYIGGTTPAVQRMRNHDYVFYSRSWNDTTRGIKYKSGYYDENGTHYDSLAVAKNGAYELTLQCQYCGTQSRFTWIKDAIPNCSNCGANLYESIGTVAYDSEPINNYSSGSLFAAPKVVGVTLATTMAIAIGASTLGVIAGSHNKAKDQDAVQTHSENYESNVELWGETIYVDSIGRTIVWTDEYDSYYDAVSDCYVAYNMDVEPAVWQYWYEDISSDYGDYGWMEYELAEDQWYIEASYNNWIELPDSYDTSSLWYMTGDQAGTSYSQDYNLENFGDYIMLDNIDSACVWNDEYLGYEMINPRGYFRVNFDVEPHTFQYWYPSISSHYGSYGWLEYDAAEDAWYVQNSDGEWMLVPDSYDTSDLVHYSTVTGSTGYELTN